MKLIRSLAALALGMFSLGAAAMHVPVEFIDANGVAKIAMARYSIRKADLEKTETWKYLTDDVRAALQNQADGLTHISMELQGQPAANAQPDGGVLVAFRAKRTRTEGKQAPVTDIVLINAMVGIDSFGNLGLTATSLKALP